MLILTVLVVSIFQEDSTTACISYTHLYVSYLSLQYQWIYSQQRYLYFISDEEDY